MRVMGLMSGTSADGVDIAIADIEGAPPQISANVIHSEMIPFSPSFQARIHALCMPETSQVDDLCALNVEIGEHFANAAITGAKNANLNLSELDLIGAHGQTMWHNVTADGTVTATLQLGEGAIIAEKTGVTTLNNFRPRDVAAGGQGAPLTSYADWLLLRHPTRWRAIQNIGGMGNVTFLPPLNVADGEPLAFDTGPGNALIDTAVVMLTDGKQMYDVDGAMGARGTIVEGWLDELLEHPYYNRKPPKTTGRELFGPEMMHDLIQQAREQGIASDDMVTTLTMLTAATITQAYRDFSPAPVEEIILGGGGARNPTLVSMMQSLLGHIPIMTHEDIGMDSDSKEALVFALLAYETWHNRPGIHPALTGASHPVVLGQIIPGNNYAALIERTWVNS